ncbi:MAG: hypothetical protein AAFY75_04140 [Pseudomonadota bacterium]
MTFSLLVVSVAGQIYMVMPLSVPLNACLASLADKRDALAIELAKRDVNVDKLSLQCALPGGFVFDGPVT